MSKKKSIGLALGNPCDPRDLPHDGRVEKGDFVCLPKNSSWVYFMKPKNPKRIPKSIHAGGTKFVKNLSSIKSFGRYSLEGYLLVLAGRNGMLAKKIETKSKNGEIWQFC